MAICTQKTNRLESRATEGDSPVDEMHAAPLAPEYHGTGEILWESTSTIW